MRQIESHRSWSHLNIEPHRHRNNPVISVRGIYSSPVDVRDKHYLISLFQFGIEISEPMEYCSIQENCAVVKGHLTLHGKCFLTEDRVITGEPVEQLHNGGSRWNGFLKGERAQAFMAKVPSQISLRLKGDLYQSKFIYQEVRLFLCSIPLLRNSLPTFGLGL